MRLPKLPYSLLSLLRTYWLPVAQEDAPAFFREQMATHRWSWMATMVVANMVFAIHGVVDIALGLVPHRLLWAELVWRSVVVAVLAMVAAGFWRIDNLRTKRRLVGVYAACLMLGLVGTAMIVPGRTVYLLFPLSFACLISIALWLDGWELPISLLVVGSTTVAWVLHQSGLDAVAASNYIFYLAISVLLGLVFRRGRLLWAFDAFLLRRRLLAQAHGDPLTGALNRAGWDERVAALPAQAIASLLYLDLDHFKAVNDTYGHPVGDQLLQDTARLIQAMVGQEDLLARFGGEEFVVFLPGQDLAQACALAEGIRHAVASRNSHPAATLSVGVAQVGKEEPLEAAIHRADGALLRAKHRGRNRVECDEPVVQMESSVSVKE